MIQLHSKDIDAAPKTTPPNAVLNSKIPVREPNSIMTLNGMLNILFPKMPPRLCGILDLSMRVKSTCI